MQSADDRFRRAHLSKGCERMNYKRKRKGILTAVCAAAVIAAAFAVSVIADIFGLGIGGKQEVLVSIPKGAGVNAISEILRDDGIIRYPLFFRINEKMHGGNTLFQLGGHMLGRRMSYSEILERLSMPPEVNPNEAVKVVVPEGFENRQIAERLEELGLADSDKFMKELDRGEFDYSFIKEITRSENRLEGYLFPATYEIMPDEDEHEIIDRMLKKFSQTVVPLYSSAKTDMTLDQIVTLASLVEREAANDDERGKVASVFYNRLHNDMTLSSCASVQYILKERKKILSSSDVKIKSPYNTYINKGLPIGPIAAPGEKSVRAALWPEVTDYLYFAARADGSENVFSKTGEEHMRIVKELQGK